MSPFERIIQVASRCGLAHNHGAGGQWLLCATEKQLIAFAEALRIEPSDEVAWPQRFGGYIPEIGGYVVWRDVFEGDMKCALRDAILTHKTAVFVTESEARDYCDYRNRRTAATGTDSVSAIEGGAKP